MPWFCIWVQKIVFSVTFNFKLYITYTGINLSEHFHAGILKQKLILEKSKENMSKQFLMKFFSLPVNTLHGLGALSQPAMPHCPSQGQDRTGDRLGRPSPGHQPPPWGKWWPRPGQELRLSGTIFPCLQRNGPPKAALSLSQPWAGSQIPRGGCSQSPHSPLRDRQGFLGMHFFC